MMTCAKCNAERAPPEKFCGECGHLVAQETVAPKSQSCPSCGTVPGDPSALFCSTCGVPLAGADRPLSNRPQPTTEGAIPSVSSMGVAPQRSRRRYVWGTIVGIAILTGLGFVGSRLFLGEQAEEQSYEHSLEKRTPEERLVIRAQNGETDEVQSLLAAGVRPDARPDSTGATALIVAGAGGHSDTVKVLVAAGADMNGQDESGLTALMAAARLGHSDTVKVLIAAGANVNVPRKSGATALTIAREAGHGEIVHMLQEAGAKE